MTLEETEIFLKKNQELPQNIGVAQMVNILQDIMMYKAINIKAHIPSWVFVETIAVLKAAYGEE